MMGASRDRRMRRIGRPPALREPGGATFWGGGRAPDGAAQLRGCTACCRVTRVVPPVETSTTWSPGWKFSVP